MPSAPVPEPETLRPPPPVPLVPVSPPVAAPVSFVFGGLSRLRGRRAMHPVGMVTHARLAVPDDVMLPADWRALDGADGIVRFSKSIGLPGRIPDVLGMALRFGTQDLLLATVLGHAPLLQHVLVPARDFDRATFSTLLPHRVGTTTAVIQARIVDVLPTAGSSLDGVRTAGEFAIELRAMTLVGGLRHIGTVVIGDALSQDVGRVRFDPWRAGAGLRPVGPLQRVRAAAYAASRRATAT